MATPAATKAVEQGRESLGLRPPSVQARLRLEFSRNPVNNHTILAESYQEPPLQVVRAFPQQDGSALVHLHNVSGGLLGGDHLTQQIHVGRGARVQVTTTGATRIYRQRPECAAATQRNQITVEANAILEYLPDATIPYAGSRYLQETFVRLEKGAGLFWWEMISPGREARGELFQYREFAVKTRITVEGKTITAENLSMQPAVREMSSLSRLGNYRYLATFYVCRAGLEANAWRGTEDHLREVTSSMTRPGEILWGVSSLVAHGLAVRCLARHGREVMPGLQAVWSTAKLHLYGQAAIPPRKVN